MGCCSAVSQACHIFFLCRLCIMAGPAPEEVLHLQEVDQRVIRVLENRIANVRTCVCVCVCVFLSVYFFSKGA